MMIEPMFAVVALPFIALALTAAGTAYGVHASMQAGKAAEEAGKYNEKVAERNAQAASQAARYEAERLRRRNAVLRGKQTAAYAKSGVILSGTPEDVIFDSAVQGEMDALASIYSGNVRSGYEQSQGMLARAEGKARGEAFRGEAIGTGLSGAGRVASGGYAISQQSKQVNGKKKQPNFED